MCCVEGGTLQTNITGMCGECSQCLDHTGFAPAHGGVCFPGLHCSGSRLLFRGTLQGRPWVACTSQAWASQVQVLGYSTKAQIKFGLRFVPFSVPSSSGNKVLGELTVSDVRCILSPSHSQPLSFLGVPQEPSQVCRVSPLGSWSQAVTLLADVNHPGSQEDLVSTWEPAHNLVEDAIFGAKIFPPLPALAVAHLPLSLQQGYGPVCSQLAVLWYSLNPLFCELARVCLKLELFTGNFPLSLFFIFLSLAVLQFGLLFHISSLRLSAGLSGQVLTLSMQPTPPSSAPDNSWWTQASGLLLCWELWLDTYSVGCFFFFLLPVMLPIEIPKLPTDKPVRGFPGVQKLLLLHKFLPRMGLHP